MKRVLCLVIVICLMMSFCTMAADAVTYKDVPDRYWGHSNILWATNEGLMNGTGGSSFSPDAPASRAMLVTVFWRMEGSPDIGSRTPFTDLKEAWYRKAVAWAYANDIVQGVGATTFAPNANITREQAATLFYRFAAYRGKTTSQSVSLKDYPDFRSISTWALKAASWTTATGLITGIPSTYAPVFQPQGNATRAQLATLLQRFYNLGCDFKRWCGSYGEGNLINGPCYIFQLENVSGGKATFSLHRLGRNCSPYYYTESITAPISAVGTCSFKWSDSWGNRGTGTFTLSNGIQGGVHLSITETDQASGNRSSLDTNGTKFFYRVDN